ncbi:MAG: hydrogenase maturation nickel metallochaperone HypA [Alphaproteobacteria bacterium]|nr:hydrogenase maturation nickel metallochaperone HypA [Alphaproteobacteria bacterium]
MHELALTREIVSIVRDHARGRGVAGVTLRVGRLSCVQVDALRFALLACVDGTELADCVWTIERVPGRARCEGCAVELDLDQLAVTCPCERQAPLTILSGEELLVSSMEVR